MISRRFLIFSWIIVVVMVLGIGQKILAGEPPTWWTVGHAVVLFWYGNNLAEHYFARYMFRFQVRTFLDAHKKEEERP